MWVIDMNGNARNLAQAYKIDFGEHKGKVKVYATFPFVIPDDTVCFEKAFLKTFDNVDDAKAFIFNVVNTMNNGNGIYNWDDFNADDDVDENQLGYSFSWLKKVEALPDEQRAEFEGKVNEWLDKNVVGSGLFHGTQGELATKNKNVPTSGYAKPQAESASNLIDGIAL